MSVEQTPLVCSKCGRPRPREEEGSCPVCGEETRMCKVIISEKLKINVSGELRTIQKIRNTPLWLVCWIIGIAPIIIGFFVPLERISSAIISVFFLIFGMYIGPYGETIINRIQQF